MEQNKIQCLGLKEFPILPNEIIQSIFMYNEKEWMILRLLSKEWFTYFTDLLFDYYIRITDCHISALPFFERMIPKQEVYTLRKLEDWGKEQDNPFYSFYVKENHICWCEPSTCKEYEYKVDLVHYGKLKKVSFLMGKRQSHFTYFFSVLKIWLEKAIPIHLFIVSKKWQQCKRDENSKMILYSPHAQLLLDDLHGFIAEEEKTHFCIQFKEKRNWDYFSNYLSLITQESTHFLELHSYQNTTFLKWRIECGELNYTTTRVEFWFIQEKECFCFYPSTPSCVLVKKFKPIVCEKKTISLLLDLEHIPLNIMLYPDREKEFITIRETYHNKNYL